VKSEGLASGMGELGRGGGGLQAPIPNVQRKKEKNRLHRDLRKQNKRGGRHLFEMGFVKLKKEDDLQMSAQKRSSICTIWGLNKRAIFGPKTRSTRRTKERGQCERRVPGHKKTGLLRGEPKKGDRNSEPEGRDLLWEEKKAKRNCVLSGPTRESQNLLGKRGLSFQKKGVRRWGLRLPLRGNRGVPRATTTRDLSVRVWFQREGQDWECFGGGRRNQKG